MAQTLRLTWDSGVTVRLETRIQSFLRGLCVLTNAIHIKRTTICPHNKTLDSKHEEVLPSPGAIIATQQ